MMQDHKSPWLTVFGLFEHFEDGLALMSLFESRREDLLANGRPLTDILNVLIVSERAVAGAIAERMCMVFSDSGWQYTNFWSPSRGLDATAEDVERFVERCRQVGIRFEYSDLRVTVDDE